MQATARVLVCKNREIIGIIRFRDILKQGIREKIQAVKAMNIRVEMITGDYPLTAKSIAKEVGIDEYVPQAKPEDKHGIVLREQANTRIVAMIGDGTNDAPALAVGERAPCHEFGDTRRKQRIWLILNRIQLKSLKLFSPGNSSHDVWRSNHFQYCK